jgi:hypothetical protein
VIVVTIQVHPGGDASRAFAIGVMTIANISGLAPNSSYDCRVATTGDAELGLAPYEARFTVHGHHRRDGVLKLLYRVLWRVRNGWSAA